nr:putative capsid protein [Crucivirus sp.]
MPRVAGAKAAPRKRAPRKKPAGSVGRLHGHGDYTYDKPGPWGKIGRSLGEHAGGMIGSGYGFKGAGSALGGKLGSYLHYIGKIFGSGDYVTAANQLKHNVLTNSTQIPVFSDGANDVRIRHREFLGDIISSNTAAAFRLQSFPINPGLLSSFPWLSQVCGATWQQYRVNGMVFEFRSMSADALNSTNTALGSVVMATDYDSADAVFTSKADMENTEFGVSCKPSSSMIHGIECARYQTAMSEQYIRSAAVPANKDIRMYDLGNFQIATVGFQGQSVNCGELWVSYDVSLLKTKGSPPGAVMGLANLQIAGATAALPLGTGFTIAAAGQDSIGITWVTGNLLSFPVLPIGTTFLLTYNLSVASAALTLPTITAGGGMTILAGFKAPAAGETATKGMCATWVQITSLVSTTAPYVNYAGMTSGAPGVTQYLDIYQVNGTTLQSP